MTKREKLKLAMELFAYFFRISFFTFGGGWSILAQMQKEFVLRRHWINEEELLDITVVSRSLPGMMITNICMMFGYRMGGVFCGLAALIGISIPPLLIIGVIAVFYEKVKDNIFAVRALVGIRAAVVPIIGAVAIKMRKSAFKSWFGYVLAAIAFMLCLFTDINIGIIVILGATVGMLAPRRVKL